MKRRASKTNRRGRGAPRARGPTSGRWRRWVRGMFALTVGAGVTVASVESVRWARRSSLLAIDTVEVHGAARARAATVRRLSGIAVGDNLLRIDVDAARDRVLSHPWVAQAEVRVSAIDRVRISVVEHQPVALVALQNLYFVDAGGRFFKRLAPGETVDLPVITGLERALIESDDPGQSAMLKSALEVVAGWDVDAYGDLSEVNVNDARGLTVVLVEDGLTVALGREDWPARLAMLGEVRAALEDRGLTAQAIDLSSRRSADRVVVRLEPPADPNGDV